MTAKAPESQPPCECPICPCRNWTPHASKVCWLCRHGDHWAARRMGSQEAHQTALERMVGNE
jgi:hypothetical protein